MTLSEAFAHFIQHPVPLGEEEIYLCTRSILDTVGAMVLGSRTGVVEKAARVIPRAGKATLAGIGGGFSAATSWSWMTPPAPIWGTPPWLCCPLCWHWGKN